jgi:hypothetical protein
MVEIEDGASFADAAETVGLEVETTPPFERGDTVPGIGSLGSTQRFAFSADVGTVSPRSVEDGGHIYAFRLSRLLKPRTLPFDEVRPRVTDELAEERRAERARQKLVDALQSGDGSLVSIANTLGAGPDTTGEFSREAFVPGVGRRNAFVAAAFRLDVGQRSDILETDRGYYVLEVLERIPADEALFAEQRDHLRSGLLNEKRQALLIGWMEKLLTDAKVEDLRSGTPVNWEPDPSDLVYVTES